MAAGDSERAIMSEVVYKVKLILHSSRWIPIILNRAGEHSPLIAICNVLLLQDKGELSLSPSEVTQRELVSGLLKRLAEFDDTIVDDVNQQLRMHDAFDMLPKLATGLDINPRFRRIDDFEDLPELQIFWFLGVKLYHGWIIDPQDTETPNAIGSNSSRTLLMQRKLLEESVKAEGEKQYISVEDWVASPSRAKFLHESQKSDKKYQRAKRGTQEEGVGLSIILSLKSPWKSSEDETVLENFTAEASLPSSSKNDSDIEKDVPFQKLISDNVINQHDGRDFDQSFPSGDLVEDMSIDDRTEKQFDLVTDTLFMSIAAEYQHMAFKMDSTSISAHPESKEDIPHDYSDSQVANPAFSSPKADPSSYGRSMPMEKIGANKTVKDREPIYGEEHATKAAQSFQKKSESKLIISAEDGNSIQKFLSNNVDQLTTHGLICLKEGLKDREPCVLYRKNQFRTMCKVDGDLYLLCSGEGYCEEVVWEKLTLVEGVRRFYRGNFTPIWDEHSYVNSILEYMANPNNEMPELNEYFARHLQIDELDAFNESENLAQNLQRQE